MSEKKQSQTEKEAPDKDGRKPVLPPTPDPPTDAPPPDPETQPMPPGKTKEEGS